MIVYFVNQQTNRTYEIKTIDYPQGSDMFDCRIKLIVTEIIEGEKAWDPTIVDAFIFGKGPTVLDNYIVKFEFIRRMDFVEMNIKEDK